MMCGDSKRNKSKKRAYFVEKKGSFVYCCFNCGYYNGFDDFLKTFDYDLFCQMCVEHYNNTDELKKQYYEDNPNNEFKRPEFYTKTALKHLKKISSLKATHPAHQYVMDRCIPTHFHWKLFYAPYFWKWVQENFPEQNIHIYEKDEPRLVIALLSQNQELYGVSCRSFIKKAKLKYITIMMQPNAPKIFNLDALDTDQRKCYCVEGAIDAMMIPNCVAMVGADLSLKDLELDKADWTMVYDNEPRNKEIVGRMRRAIDKGMEVCIWPEDFKYKDMNEAIMAGLSSEFVQSIIDNNTYSGVPAIVRLSFWKRVK
jgi:hypothetical protein